MSRTLLARALPALVAAGVLVQPARADDPVSINIYAMPSKEVVDAVAAVSGELARNGLVSFFEKGHAVHATLYLTSYPAGVEDDLKTAMAALAKETAPFPFAVDGIEVTADNWVFVGIDRTPELQRLSDRVVIAAEPFRATDVAAPGWMKDYPEKTSAFERYGSPNVFMQFNPHLTLLASESDPRLAAFIEWAKANPVRGAGRVTGIAIGYADTNGQITETIAEFPFGGAE